MEFICINKSNQYYKFLLVLFHIQNQLNKNMRNLKVSQESILISFCFLGQTIILPSNFHQH